MAMTKANDAKRVLRHSFLNKKYKIINKNEERDIETDCADRDNDSDSH